jgi:hypothetical protein
MMTLATARVTQFIVDDEISSPLRLWIMNKLGEDYWITYLIHCYICASVWVGIGAAIYTWLGWDISGWFVGPLALAYSYGALLLNKLME